MPRPRSIREKSKGERTREQVIHEAAALFNQLGYANASMSDIMQATGLQKGGIYRHFESKQALVLAAFDYAIAELGARFEQALQGKSRAIERLHAVVDVYAKLPVDPPVPGGCPVLNAAVESDDSDPILKERVRQVLHDWQAYLRKTLREGQRKREVKGNVDADEFTTLMVAALEGAIMISKLQASQTPMRRVTKQLHQMIDALSRC